MTISKQPLEYLHSDTHHFTYQDKWKQKLCLPWSLTVTNEDLKNCDALPINPAIKNNEIHPEKMAMRRAYPAGAVAHPEPPPSTVLAPFVHASCPPPEMKNSISLGTPEKLIDFVEPPPKVKHSPAGTEKLSPLVPVQSAPENPVTVAESAREADTRIALETKMAVNCIAEMVWVLNGNKSECAE